MGNLNSTIATFMTGTATRTVDSSPSTLLTSGESSWENIKPSCDFNYFAIFPIELQMRIWEYSLLSPSVTARILRITYDAKSDSYIYHSTIPHALQTTHLSRSIAQKIYIRLSPDPVQDRYHYFYPAVDFLYYVTPLTEPTSTSMQASYIPPFLPSSLDTSKIQHLVINYDFWTLRCKRSLQPPIPELQSFSSLTRVFLAHPPLTYWLASMKTQLAIYRTSMPPSLRLVDLDANLDRRFHAKQACHRDASLSRVPGFVLVDGNAKQDWLEMNLERCFSSRIPIPVLDEFEEGVISWERCERWRGRCLPHVGEVRAK